MGLLQSEKTMSFHVPERYRHRIGEFGTTEANGNNGCFWVLLPHNQKLKVFATDGAARPGETAWEHVSVSRRDRCPTWEEMCRVKELFWDDDDCVIQYHPPRADWISNHSFCLHMWRPVGIELPRPPSIMVGIAGAGTLV
jgi:hypothetical protein